MSNGKRKDAFDRAGVERIRADGVVADLHSLRKILGTVMAWEGVPPQIAQKIMRHSTLETTMRFYTDLGLAHAAEAMARISAPTTTPTSRGAKPGDEEQQAASAE